MLSKCDSGRCQRIYRTTPIKKVMDFMREPTVHRNLGANGGLARIFRVLQPPSPLR